MAKNPKMIICRNCNNPMPKGAKTCPSCGAKNKKPFYKKGWFIVLAAIVIICIIASISNGKKSSNKSEKFQWNDIELSDILPEPQSHVGEISLNSDKQLSIYVYKTSKDDYKEYINECQSQGFTVESEKTETTYRAYNDAGYELKLIYSSGDERLYISLESPMEMETLQWPSSEIAGLLPVPKSTVGSISQDSSIGFSIYVGKTPKDDYNEYVTACSEKGFSVNYEKGNTYYQADNAGGYHLSLTYQGNNVMFIELTAPKEPAPDTSNETVSPEDTNSPVETDPPQTEAADTSPNDEPDTSPETPSDMIDGMHRDFKAAMDSYEAFYNEYCDFMKKYNENPSDLELLTKYAEMMAKAVDMNKKFEEWDEESLNSAELKYYAEVNTRVTQRLLEIAQ